MKNEIIEWLYTIENHDGIPPDTQIAFNLGLIESDHGFMMYFVSSSDYSEENDDWACIEPPANHYRYLKLPQKLQTESWKTILDNCKNALCEMEIEDRLNKTLVKNAKAITIGFDDSELIKIR